MEQWERQERSVDPPDDFWVVGLLGADDMVVSAEQAAAVEEQLDQVPQPPWITFHSFTGCRIRLRAHLIGMVYEITAAQRAHRRAFNRAMKAEEQDWSDEG